MSEDKHMTETQAKEKDPFDDEDEGQFQIDLDIDSEGKEAMSDLKASTAIKEATSEPKVEKDPFADDDSEQEETKASQPEIEMKEKKEAEEQHKQLEAEIDQKLEQRIEEKIEEQIEQKIEEQIERKLEEAADRELKLEVQEKLIQEGIARQQAAEAQKPAEYAESSNQSEIEPKEDSNSHKVPTEPKIDNLTKVIDLPKIDAAIPQDTVKETETQKSEQPALKETQIETEPPKEETKTEQIATVSNVQTPASNPLPKLSVPLPPPPSALPKKNLFAKKVVHPTTVPIKFESSSLFSEEQTTSQDPASAQQTEEATTHTGFVLEDFHSKIPPKLPPAPHKPHPAPSQAYNTFRRPSEPTSSLDTIEIMSKGRAAFYWTENNIMFLGNGNKWEQLALHSFTQTLHEECISEQSPSAERASIACKHLSNNNMHQIIEKAAEFLCENTSIFAVKEAQLNFFTMLVSTALQKRIEEDEYHRLVTDQNVQHEENKLLTVNRALLAFIASLPPANLIQQKQELNAQFQTANHVSRNSSLSDYLKFCLKTELFNDIITYYHRDEEIAFLALLRSLLLNRHEVNEATLKAFTSRFYLVPSLQLLCFLINPELVMTIEGYNEAILSSTSHGNFELFDLVFNDLRRRNLPLAADFYAVFLIANMPQIVTKQRQNVTEYYTKLLVDVSNQTSPDLFKNPFFGAFVRYYRDLLVQIKKYESAAPEAPKQQAKGGIFGFMKGVISNAISKPNQPETPQEKIEYDPVTKRYLVNGKVMEEHKDEFDACVQQAQNQAPGIHNVPQPPPKPLEIKRVPLPKPLPKIEPKVSESSLSFGQALVSKESTITQPPSIMTPHPPGEQQESQNSNTDPQPSGGFPNLKVPPPPPANLARKNQLTKNRFVAFGQPKS